MKYLVSDINEMVRRDPALFIAESEAAYMERIKNAAGAIMKNLSQSPIVLLSGPSGAGKTTTARKIEDELKAHGINTYTISMDNYFKTLNFQTCPRTPEGEVDYESPELLDMELLNEHFKALSEGREIHIPYYMFTRQKRSASQFTKMRLNDNEIAIFEGIHALNDVITDKNPGAFGLYISAEAEMIADDGAVFKPEWTRLVRRVVRDNNFRGADAKYTMGLWANVMRGERAHITPYIPKARLRLDSTLPYELPLLRDHALPQLIDFSEDTPGYDEISRVVPLLEQFESISSDLVPTDSLLREFIGGGIYEY